jgi:hypothetical protein
VLAAVAESFFTCGAGEEWYCQEGKVKVLSTPHNQHWLAAAAASPFYAIWNGYLQRYSVGFLPDIDG